MGSMDSPWSWVVCAVTFFSHIVAIGFSYAISVYYVEFLTVFNESSGTTSWLSSLNYGMLCLIGPVASLFNDRYSTRVTMFIGGILSAIGLVISSFATNFIVILFSFGILTGIGYGLAYTAAIVAIGEHFFKYRSLAFGLSLAGGSIGNMVFPWISTALINHFGWRGALLISSGFSLNLTVFAMLVVKRGKGDDLPMEMTEEEMKKGFKSWSGYYFSSQLYCVDEEAEKGEFFWNIKDLVSIPACPVDYNDYKLNANSTVTTTIDQITKKNTTNNSSIKDGVVLNVEGLNNDAYESSTDNLENPYYLQFEIPKPKTDNKNFEILKDEAYEVSGDNSSIKDGVVLTVEGLNNEAYESSTDNLENPHYLQFEIPKPKSDDENIEISKDNSENHTTNSEISEEYHTVCENGQCVIFEIPKEKSTDNDKFENSKDNSENPPFLQFEIPKPKTDIENIDISKGNSEISETNSEASEEYHTVCENGQCVIFEIPKQKSTDNDKFEIPKDSSENPPFLPFEMPKTKTNNETYDVSEDNSHNPHYLQFEIPKPKIDNENAEMSEVTKPKLNADDGKENAEDKNAVQNGIKTKSANTGSKKIRIKSKKEIKVKKSFKEKMKILYTNVSFVLLLISLSLFLFGTSVVYTHILPYAESQDVSSSSGLLLVSVLGGAGLAGKIGLGAIAQLPRINPIVLYIVAVFLCGAFTILLAVWNSLPGLVICTLIFGFFSSAFSPTANECVFNIAGPEMFNFSYGQAILFMGVGWVVGAPAAGLLYDATMYYPGSLYLGGAVNILGALVMVPAAMKDLRKKY